ncbi:MAG: protein kinase [Acidobacteriota bacterium]
MRTCPACQRAYDSQKSFCVYDGQALITTQEIDPLVDRVIDNKYSIDYKIAEGGTGTVYRATHLQLQSVVAIKVMHTALANDAIAIERFRREAYAAMKVRHPNAVAVLDFGITEDRLIYVVMELLIGQSLADRLKIRNRFSILEANNLMQQICAAVSAAHARGIVHRDLKPENIFLHQEDGQETVKVVDFGIAKVQDFSFTDQSGDLTAGGAVVGTPYYISPEQCSGQTVDARADVYSLGIMLYQMLTGQLPFDGPSSIIVLLKQLNEKPLPIYQVHPELPQLLNGVVMHALEKDPRARPQSVVSFAQELAAATRAVSELEFQDVFMGATEKELEAALLFTSDGNLRGRVNTSEYSRPRLELSEERQTQERYYDRGPETRTSKKITDSLFKQVQGHLSWFDLASVIHVLLGLQETGLLTLHNMEVAPDEKINVEEHRPFARIYLENGNVTRTKLGVRTGREAFYQLFQMPLEGCFVFRQVPIVEELESTEVILETGNLLLKEALGLRTLVSRFALKFPDMLVSFKRRVDQISWRDTGTLDLANRLWEMLAQAGITLTELLARSPCCNAKTYQVLAMLLATRQINFVKPGASVTSTLNEIKRAGNNLTTNL